MTTATPTGELPPSLLWIDGVGSALIGSGPSLTIGRVTSAQTRSRDVSGEFRLPLRAELEAAHVRVFRGEEGHLLQAGGTCALDGTEVHGTAALPDECELRLGSDVRLRIRRPSLLSLSLVIDFVSSHRPAEHVDSVVWLDEHCLLGPEADCHLRSVALSRRVALFRTGPDLRLRDESGTSEPLRAGQPADTSGLNVLLEPYVA